MHSHTLQITAAAACAVLLAACAGVVITYTADDGAPAAGPHAVEFTQIRSAAINVEYAGTTFLIDPNRARSCATTSEKDMNPQRVLVPEDGETYSF